MSSQATPDGPTVVVALPAPLSVAVTPAQEPLQVTTPATEVAAAPQGPNVEVS